MKSALLSGIALLVVTTASDSYEVGTHDVLSLAAVSRSTLVTTDLLRQSFGLEGPDTVFPDSLGVPQKVDALISRGAQLEDTLSLLRPLNHFFNPMTGRGLSYGIFPTQNPSPNWVLEDITKIQGQQYSYRIGRQYLLNALTKSAKKERDQSFGLMFQTLGHVIHHVQDMAQPQHVRNDVHCDFPPCAFIGAFAPSGYEIHTDKVSETLRTDPALAGPQYQLSDTATNNRFLSMFNTPRKFWHTEAPGPNSPVLGKGIAEFTQRNFVSAGTNFASGSAGFGPNANFPLPVPTSTPSNVEVVDIASLPGTSGLRGQVWFVKSQVVDNFTGAPPVENPRAATFSIFDNDLQRVNPGFGRIFSLNSFNYDEAHKFLIPRAVAYSAGLINYFFRGKLDYVDDPQLPGVNRIRNLSNETMKGTFAFYYDATDGTRSPVPNARWEGITLPPYNASITNPADPAYGFAVAFNPPTDPAPKPRGNTCWSLPAILVRRRPKRRLAVLVRLPRSGSRVRAGLW